MSQHLSRIHEIDDTNSEAVKVALSGFFQNLPKYKEVDCSQWLRGLENVINRYPKYCGTYRPTIESYVIHFLSSDNIYNVTMAAKCAHAVQQVRPAQEKGATAKICWRELMVTLCDSAHKLIDVIFCNNPNVYKNKKYNQKEKNTVLYSTLQDTLAQLDTQGELVPLCKQRVLSTRLRNVLIFIQAMLVEVYPIAKPVQPQLILEVILQALSAPGINGSDNVVSIKIQALRTLDALVACLGSNLIPFSALIFRFVKQTLKWSSEYPSEQISKVRIAAYSSLSTWLQCLHVLCPTTDGRARHWHDELTEHIIADVTPTRQIVQLKVNAQPMKNLSKKARKRIANQMLKESNIALHGPWDKNKNKWSEKTNEEVASAALECAETFLTVCGFFLKTATHKQFQELLVRECFAIQDHNTDRAIYLLRALEACRKSCSMKVPPPTQYCLQLYSVLINSSDREVSKFCSQALLNIRLHLHCSPASLCYSLEEETHKKKQKEEGRKRTTERNRAVLEKLLGIDWMNSEDPTTITIPDEPEAKRSRVVPDANVVQTDANVDEVTENVSISSDSVQSVEMTSGSDDESIIEGVELPRELTDSNDEVTIEQDVRDTSHNSNNEVIFDGGVRANSHIPTRNEPSQDFEGSIHNETTQAVPIISDDDDEYDSVIDLDMADESWDGSAEAEGMELAISQYDIHEAQTQLLQNSDTVDGRRSPISMEVGYDYPNTGNEIVPVLGNNDDDNLPSTNDTDDIPITCGQVIKSSLDVVAEIHNRDEEMAASGNASEKAATDSANEKTATDNQNEKAATDNANEGETSDKASNNQNVEAVSDNANEKAATDNQNEKAATDNANEEAATGKANEKAATNNANEEAATDNPNEEAATANNQPIKVTFQKALTIRDMMGDFVDEVGVEEVILLGKE